MAATNSLEHLEPPIIENFNLQNQIKEDFHEDQDSNDFGEASQESDSQEDEEEEEEDNNQQAEEGEQ